MQCTQRGCHHSRRGRVEFLEKRSAAIQADLTRSQIEAPQLDVRDPGHGGKENKSRCALDQPANRSSRT